MCTFMTFNCTLFLKNVHRSLACPRSIHNGTFILIVSLQTKKSNIASFSKLEHNTQDFEILCPYLAYILYEFL